MPMEPSPTTQTWKALADAMTVPPGCFVLRLIARLTD
jgi:hypothetical protein